MKHFYIVLTSFLWLQIFLILQFLSGGAYVNTTPEIDMLTDLDCQTIEVSILSNPTPKKPDFLSVFPGETINFKGNAKFSDSASGATFAWSFGNGATANGTSVSHAYNKSGKYQVSYMVTDPLGCIGTSTLSVIVLENIITVNNEAYPESSFTPEKLIKNVLITGGCSEINNVSASVFGSSSNLREKSYGYFTKGRASGFPFDEGVILSTGSAFDAGNNKIIQTISGRQSRPGDADLESALGINKTEDATFIKFNFTPLSDNISFRYLMASEEYDQGHFECEYSDGFAFLLREVGTTTYKNIAVLPHGIPVSVTNINNGNYCQNNSEFLQGYNLGQTNFNGRTKVLTASASVIPNKVYEIKLVVADQGDDQYDSAIFLEAGSFNLGVELGDDLTISNNTAGCFDQAVTLDTGAPSGVHTWYKNGVEIVEETVSVLEVDAPGNYSVKVVFAEGCEIIDTILVEFYSAMQTSPSEDLSTCNSANGIFSYDLTQNDSIVLVGLEASQYDVTYYESFTDSENLTNFITNTTNYPGNENHKIYVRIENSITGCFSLDDFSLKLYDPPVINPAKNLSLCDTDNPGDMIEQFDLTKNENEIINGQMGVTVTYHLSSLDAESGNSPIDASNFTNSSPSETIYFRVTNDLTGCYSTSDFDIVVNPLPEVSAVTDFIICETNTNGIGIFDLSSKNEEILKGQDPNTYMVSYHASQIDADNLERPLSISYQNNSAYQQRIYVAVTSVDTGCSISALNFLLEVQEIPVAFTPLEPYAVCDLLGDNDGFGQFDLALMDEKILGSQDSVSHTVRYFLTLTDAESGENAVSNIFRNTIQDQQTLYARVDNASSSNICYALAELILEVELLPELDFDETYFLCVGNEMEVINAPLLDTGLSLQDYSFEWFFEDVFIDGETNPSLSAIWSGTYSVAVTSRTTTCFKTERIAVKEIDRPILKVEVNSEAFLGTNTITALASGNGTYEFSLDGGPWQENGIFTNVSAGAHEVTLRDFNGCGFASKTLMVVDYPRYFTPNGDGYNDTWNIVGLDDQQSAKIYIFDRYGKLLQQILTTGPGWNGTFNGKQMPQSDYWFTLEYREPISGEKREFKAHFTLKR